jgi:hypothetical protein
MGIGSRIIEDMLYSKRIVPLWIIVGLLQLWAAKTLCLAHTVFCIENSD